MCFCVQDTGMVMILAFAYLLFMELQCKNHFCSDGQGVYTCSWSCCHGGGSYFLELECSEVE
jgi:hypothetical protein